MDAPVYNFNSSNDFGTTWEEKILRKIQLVFPEACKPFESPLGDIMLHGKWFAEVKAETQSANSKRCLFEYEKCVNHNPENHREYETKPSCLTITESKYYIHCDTDNMIFITPTDKLLAHIKTLGDVSWERNARFNQGGYDTFYNMVYVQYSALKTMSAWGYYHNLTADVIQKFMKP